MIECFGYIRVSTAKQGEGVSLQEQRASIEHYAVKNGIRISRWFEEKETAAKRGRPIFSKMLRLLTHGASSGVIIHKIDRSARNLRDWADLGDLIDAGISIHFANEGLDLKSRSARLSADIQAVVAADYIRNLREEAKKGFYGRLKQGVLPLPAPIGYRDCGAGIPKAIDPETGPFVRKAFELYATGRYSLKSLSRKLAMLGLKTKRGTKINTSSLSLVLNNPFYIGLIRIRSTGEIFQGGHKPLITKELFENVKALLVSKTHTKKIRHEHLFRRRLNCALCGKRLIGELQKGHTYYRCHTKGCMMKCIREEVVQQSVLAKLKEITFTKSEMEYMAATLDDIRSSIEEDTKSSTQSIQKQLGALKMRLMRLTDAFLDGSIDKEIYDERKAELLFDRRKMQDQKLILKRDPQQRVEAVVRVLELASSAWLTYESGNTEERREILKLTTSNFRVSPESVAVEMSHPISVIEKRKTSLCSGPYRGIPRTADQNITREKSSLLPSRTRRRLDNLLRSLFGWSYDNRKSKWAK